jgi:hypothetical protein
LEPSLADTESRDDAGVKIAEPEQVITFSNSHHDEDESDEDEEYANDMKEIYGMIDPPEVRTPVMNTPEARTPVMNTPEVRTPVMNTPEVRTPVMNGKEISYPKSGKPVFFGADDIEETASVVSLSGSDDSSEPGGRDEDDSMSALNRRLEDIEKELFTHSMDAYNKSLEDIF